MATFRSFTTSALIVCLMTRRGRGSLLAAEPAVQVEPSGAAVGSSTLEFGIPGRLVFADPHPSNLTSVDLGAPRHALGMTEAESFAQYGYHREHGHGWHNGAAVAAVVLGAAASITGSALLVYANRPECGTNPNEASCSYGTKVVGGAVLAGGIVSMTAGAIMWRR